MKSILPLVLCIGAGGLAGCGNDPPVSVRVRTIAFDNVYGQTTQLPVQVKVDGGAEQALIATCDAKTCSFKLPLVNGKHDLEVAVVQQGRRSQPSRVTVDTSSLP